MSKSLTAIFISALVIMVLCNLYDTFIFKPRVAKEPKTGVIYQHEGGMTYFIFMTKTGSSVVNYTLDSAEYEARKKFDQQ